MRTTTPAIRAATIPSISRRTPVQASRTVQGFDASVVRLAIARMALAGNAAAIAALRNWR